MIVFNQPKHAHGTELRAVRSIVVWHHRSNLCWKIIDLHPIESLGILLLKSIFMSY